MARRRKTNKNYQEERDAHDVASEAAPQALHRANVRSLGDRRHFTPQPQVLHALGTLSTILRTPNNRTRSVPQRNKKPLSARKREAPRRSRKFHKKILSRRTRSEQARDGQLRKNLTVTIPRNVAVCVRRKERREVIFAKNKMRAGSGAKRHRNLNSNIWCK